MRTLILQLCLFALIGLMLSPLTAHTSSSSTGQSNEPISTFSTDDNAIASVTFSPDGRLLALEEDFDSEEFKLWDVSEGQSIADFSRRGVTAGTATLSPDGQWLAAWKAWTDDGTIELWDVSGGVQHVATISAYDAYEEFEIDVIQKIVSFSPDGRRLASIGRAIGGPPLWLEGLEFKLWDLSHGVQRVATINDPITSSVVSLVFSPNGRLLASNQWGSIELWDLSRGVRHGAPISAHEGVISGVAVAVAREDLSFSSDGSLLASVGVRWLSELRSPENEGDEIEQIEEVKVWDVSTGQSIATLAGSEPVSFSPNGRLLASASERKTKIVGEEYEGYLTFQRFISGGQNIELWDVSTGQSIATLPLSGELKEYNQQPQVLVFSPDGQLLASQFSNHVQLWDVSEWIPLAWLTPDPAEVQFDADDPAWKTFTVHTILDSVLVRANPSGSDPALELTGGQQVPTTDYCPAEGNDRPTSGRRDGWSLHVKACQVGQTKILLIDYDTGAIVQEYEVNVEASTSASDGAEEEADEPQARLTPDPAAIAFSADDPAWKTFTVHTNLDSVLVRANPAGSDPALEVAGGQQVPTRDYCPAEGNDRPTRGRRDGWSLHVKACQAGQTKILLIDYDTGEVVQEYEVNVEASTSAAVTTVLNPSYPNPFNSETVLSYTLPTTSDIRLEVFTLSGQRVAVLHEGFQAGGLSHAISGRCGFGQRRLSISVDHPGRPFCPEIYPAKVNIARRLRIAA